MELSGLINARLLQTIWKMFVNLFWEMTKSEKFTWTEWKYNYWKRQQNRNLKKNKIK
jgi:hypothetical protein